MNCKRIAIGLFASTIVFVGETSRANADGGAVRASVRQGRWEITVFTMPTPPRAGAIDVSVLIQDAATGQVATGVTVSVRAEPRGRPGGAFEIRATAEAAENKLLRAAALDLPDPGWWDFTITIEDDTGARTKFGFAIELGEPTPGWLKLVPWIAWPAGVVLLFGIHRLLVRRREQRL